MSFIAEFHITSPIMRDTTAPVPSMEFRTEDLHFGEDAKFVFWASGDDFDQLESTVVADPPVTEYALLTEDSRVLSTHDPLDASSRRVLCSPYSSR